MGSFLLSSYRSSSAAAYPAYPSLYPPQLEPQPSALDPWSLAAGHSAPYSFLTAPPLDRRESYSQSLRPQPAALQRWASLPLSAGDLAPYSSLTAPSLDHHALVGSRLVVPVHVQPELVGNAPLTHASLIGGVVNRQSVPQGLGPNKAISKASKLTSKESKVQALVKEVRELHALWRKGVVEPSFHIAGKKRNAGKAKDGGGKPSKEVSKKSKRKNRTIAQEKKVFPVVPKPLGLDAWEESSIDPQPMTWGGSTEPLTAGAIPLAKKSVITLTDEEKQAVISLDLQKQARKCVREFFTSGSDDDESDDETVSDSDGEAEFERVKSREEKAFGFFSKLFEENEQLRKLYVDECNCGKFECLVCSGIDSGKLAKSFDSLVSLVMHASKILKTKKRPEHRAYGRAVCSVLGWDPLRTPTLPKGKDIHPRGCIPPNEDAADATAQPDDDHNPEGVSATKVVEDTTA